jgi:hypothetical protein
MVGHIHKKKGLDFVMSKELHLFESHEWLGHFSYPDGSFAFPGILKYSPENGVQLEYLCELRGDINRTPHLFGALENGKSCTLIGDFNPREGGLSVGSVSIYRGTWGFRYCIFGATVSPDALFSGIWVDFSHFQEFCFPQGFKATAPWQQEPLSLFRSDSVEIAIVQTANFDLAGSHYANIFHSDNKQLLADFESFMGSLKSKYPDDFLYARKDIKWLLRIRRLEGSVVGDLVKDIFSIANLLSLMLFYPVRPIEITVMQARADGKFDSLEMLMGIGNLNNETLEFFRREPSNFRMPIKMSNIDAGKVFGNWLKLSEGYDSFVPKIANDFGIRTDYQTRAEIVLLIAQLEKINQELGGGYGKRFEYPITHYGSTELTDLMRDALLLPNLSEDIGSKLSDLRGEIAHFGRPANLLHQLSAVQLMVVCRCMDLVIASHIYKQLGINDEIVGEFQKQHVGNMRDFLSR